MQRLRKAIKQDPVNYKESKKRERERYYRRKEQGMIKPIADLSRREQRSLRKNWRIRSKKSYDKRKGLEKQVNHLEILPSSLVQIDLPGDPILMLQHSDMLKAPTPRSSAGKKRSRRNRKMLKSKIKELEKKLKQESSLKEKYRKRLYRQREKEREQHVNSPNKKVKTMVRGQKLTPTIYRALLFGEVLSAQAKKNLSNTVNREEKRKLVSTISGRIIKKYKCQGRLETLASSRLCQPKNIKLNCKEKEIVILDYNPNEVAKYEKWVLKKEMLVIKGKQKQCTKKVKELITCTEQQLVLE
ncbi:hypothetical protein ABEB36_009207 [Hypothenemus hampei]|uniref:Uncharacterized protein n=1 Tax=Hypothenemus hampei TaxID=57062 RepID=A0ABD1EPH3_HYPHA